MGTHPIFESDFDCLTENDSSIGKINSKNNVRREEIVLTSIPEPSVHKSYSSTVGPNWTTECTSKFVLFGDSRKSLSIAQTWIWSKSASFSIAKKFKLLKSKTDVIAERFATDQNCDTPCRCPSQTIYWWTKENIIARW